jgi:putative sterol carrier protein
MQIAIETNAQVNEQGQITLDEPLKLAHNSRIRVIVITSEEEGEEPEDTPIEEIREGIYQGWQDMLAGRTKPVSQLWEGMDVD